MNAPRGIIVVTLSAVGDVLHGVPVAVALKRAFPSARIGWVVESPTTDVLAGHPAIDHLFRLPSGWSRSPRTVIGLRRQLQWFAADACIDLQGTLKSAVVTLLSGAAMRIGHARPAARACARLAYTRAVASPAGHPVDRNLALLGPLGVQPAQAAFEMPRWPVSRLRMTRWVESLRLPRPPVLLNPGADAPAQRWPAARYVELARALARRDGQPVVVAWHGDRDRDVARQIVTGAAGSAIAAPQTSLQDLGELCRLSRVFVSGDAGPLHLAAALSTPCVGLFGLGSASHRGPYGTAHACLEPSGDVEMPGSERQPDGAAIAAIDVGSVVAATESALARCRAA